MGIELAKAFVTVRGDNTALGADLQKSRGSILGSLRGIASRATGILAGIGIPLAGGAVFGSLITAGEEFNQKMRQSQAIMGDLTHKQMEEMKTKAFEVAKTTKFSASEAAESYFFLASAGLDAKQSIEALPQVAAFAQAGMFDMARATDLATDAQSALGLTVDDAQENLTNLKRVTDVLVKANTLANASVEQFSEALTNRAATSARAVGKEMEEVVAVLAALADQGVKGALAGNAFGIVLRDLSTAAQKNAKVWKDENLAVFDEATGEMRNMADIIGDLEVKLQGMSDKQKLATLTQLGFADRSKQFILTLLGTSNAIRDYEAKLEKAGGTTQMVADKQLTPLQKGMAVFGAAWTQLSETLVTSFSPAIQAIMGDMGAWLEQMGAAVTQFAETTDLSALLRDTWMEMSNAAGALREVLTTLLIEFVKLATGMNDSDLTINSLGDAFTVLNLGIQEFSKQLSFGIKKIQEIQRWIFSMTEGMKLAGQVMRASGVFGAGAQARMITNKLGLNPFGNKSSTEVKEAAMAAGIGTTRTGDARNMDTRSIVDESKNQTTLLEQLVEQGKNPRTTVIGPPALLP